MIAPSPPFTPELEPRTRTALVLLLLLLLSVA